MFARLSSPLPDLIVTLALIFSPPRPAPPWLQDYKESFCSLQRFKDGLASWFLPRSWRSSPHLVRAKLAFSRTTGLLFSYKGALRIQSAMPVTRELDLWYRDLITDGLLKVYVTCPRVVGIMGLPTVT